MRTSSEQVSARQIMAKAAFWARSRRNGCEARLIDMPDKEIMRRIAPASPGGLNFPAMLFRISSEPRHREYRIVFRRFFLRNRYPGQIHRVITGLPGARSGLRRKRASAAREGERCALRAVPPHPPQ